eukprot:GHVR01023978.1.p1 GENE.GHVR01023978.1~~GHVR01023978.1.p1  ORF type:complete len:245 (-),score=72.91 GHVR01023978.1:103-837(-)
MCVKILDVPTVINANTTESLEKQKYLTKISIWQGDITTLQVDAIVNATNTELIKGGGVDGAIHHKAGKELDTYNRKVYGGCREGDSVVSPGFSLPSKHVISTTGPFGEKPRVLHSCYTNCLELMRRTGLKSIAFPCVSTGVYGYGNEAACKVALSATREWLTDSRNYRHLERIIFCTFLPCDTLLYQKYVPIFLGDATPSAHPRLSVSSGITDTHTHIDTHTHTDTRTRIDPHTHKREEPDEEF